MPSGRVSQLHITLTAAQRQALLQSTGSLIEARGRLCVLFRAAGLPVSTIAARLGLARHKVYVWLNRYLAEGLAGCYDHRRHNGRKPLDRSPGQAWKRH